MNPINVRPIRFFAAAFIVSCICSAVLLAGEPVQAQGAGEKLVPIPIQLPKPMFEGTPQNLNVPNLEKPLGKPRDPFLAPAGVVNVAKAKKVVSSDMEPVIGELELITDGDKKGADGSFVELGPGVQHVTVDLGAMNEIYAIVVWHFHKTPRVYFDVIIQVADDAAFKKNVRTIFNNDHDNTSALGAGKDRNYVETSEGKLVDAKGARARFVRAYAKGNNANDLNHYVELEVYGRPAK
jgi:hypothetical protein